MKIEFEEKAVIIEGVRYVREPEKASHMTFDDNGNVKVDFSHSDVIAAFNKHCEKLSKLESVKKWEPPEGNYIVNGLGKMQVSTTYAKSQKTMIRDFGTCRATKEQAEASAKRMRAANRIEAFVYEYAPDWVGIQALWHVHHSDGVWRYSITHGYTPGVVYMPRHVAKKLCAMLNSGEVEL